MLRILTICLVIVVSSCTTHKSLKKTKTEQLILDQITLQHLPGVAVCVIKDNKVVYKSGNGYADVRQKKEIDPEETLFRIMQILFFLFF